MEFLYVLALSFLGEICTVVYTKAVAKDRIYLALLGTVAGSVLYVLALSAIVYDLKVLPALVVGQTAGTALTLKFFK